MGIRLPIFKKWFEKSTFNEGEKSLLFLEVSAGKITAYFDCRLMKNGDSRTTYRGKEKTMGWAATRSQIFQAKRLEDLASGLWDDLTKGRGQKPGTWRS